MFLYLDSFFTYVVVLIITRITPPFPRQGPRFSIRMIIWIFCSDTLVMMSISPVSTVIFPKSETAMLSKLYLTFLDCTGLYLTAAHFKSYVVYNTTTACTMII